MGTYGQIIPLAFSLTPIGMQLYRLKMFTQNFINVSNYQEKEKEKNHTENSTKTVREEEAESDSEDDELGLLLAEELASDDMFEFGSSRNFESETIANETSKERQCFSPLPPPLRRRLLLPRHLPQSLLYLHPLPHPCYHQLHPYLLQIVNFYVSTALSRKRLTPKFPRH
ncbi:uncharacterized protein MONOS_11894 [Monocercomonoides exilis]|uniref:uncharacterized protein n=1 Tax=Monocercomonoides exilis TaxID=2049356 RepID=UPI00355A7F16|nr:hypothetical protein MONOS_11894 [Monocercomonoides exilis]|eukprot:MONOS_11894.1-p1 / transcript=MONOS_11894.1 / gene=MONOS_11894 / organism=Monocercomonoides_exilis_PA203 / gene_product=unspecified product / transcript_product=unspecified product / location=Mono_scaffold00622:19838-20710(-) / protein_length=170 / sequence_SO=supercontig / SO=protein_coding / is_pseudo=false